MASFGFGAAGVSAAEEDLYRQAATEKVYGDIAQQPFEMRQQQAKAEKAELELAQRRRLATLAASRRAQPQELDPDQDPAEIATKRLYEFAGDYLDAGMPDHAGKIAGAAAQVRQRAAAARNSEANERKNTIEGEIKASELLGRHINPNTVTDQASWDRAWEQLGMEAPGAYDPRLVKDISTQALSVYQQRTTELSRFEKESADRLRRQRIQEIIDRRPLVKAQTEATLARRDRLRALGASGGNPKASELRLITDKLRSDYFNATPEEARNEAVGIWERAQEMIAGNPALRYHEAAERAYLEKRESGTLEQYGRNKPKTPIGGKTKTSPLPIPRGPGGKVLMDKVVKDRWYSTQHGPLFWNGKTFSTTGEGSDDDEED